ncbi:CACNA1B [Symbiodinium sp. CCMP2592]|nr:CACNA1B [Symbiodinium sp. CCMP2592]
MASDGPPRWEERNAVPVWNGKAEDFAHFVTEVKWTLYATKREERPLLAARIIRKALQSGHSTLVQLMYKLNPDDYTTEGSVQKLVKYLEESPLNRQPLPDAGTKIGAYYRRLLRRHHEPLPSFLVREDKVHDDMLRALQRLLRERELVFEGYDTDVEELKRFCGIQEGESVYFGPPEGDDADPDPEAGEQPAETEDDESEDRGRRSRHSSRSSRRSSRHGKGSEKGSWKGAPPRGKDLLERLMEKGLMPLSALDVIRGWMVLEMSTSTEEERRVIKAATRNRLGYQEVRQALLSMFEDRGGKSARTFAPGKGAYHVELDREYADDGAYYTDAAYVTYQDDGGENMDDWWGQPAQWGYYTEAEPGQEWSANWAEEEADPGEAEIEDEVYAVLKDDQREYENQRQEIEAMLAENDRNLMEARRAVAAAAKDRGWGSVQQRQPKPTSTYMSKNNKGKGHGKGGGKKGAKLVEEANWVSKGQGKKGKPFSKGASKGPKGPPTWAHAYHLDGGLEFFTTVSEAEARGSTSTMAASEGLVDTGATATAGGQDAVERLCAAVAAARQETQITVFESERPYFRYGSGKWGRALYRVCLECAGMSFSMFALPSEGVPVLVGMRELRQMNAFLGCATGRTTVTKEIKSLGPPLADTYHQDLGNPNDINRYHCEPSADNLNRQSNSNRTEERAGQLQVGIWALHVPSETAATPHRHVIMATGSGDPLPSEMKAAIQAAVREAIAGELKNTITEELKNTSTKTKGKGCSRGSGEKTEYDTTRKQGPDERDPRGRADQWPCLGRHSYGTGANRYGKWSECTVCGHRVSYIPARDAPGQTTKTNLPMNVTEALDRLRAEGRDPAGLEVKDVKSMIEIVAREKRLLYGKPKSKTKPAAEPKRGTKNKDPKTAVVVEDEDLDGYDRVEATEKSEPE